jgi:hypothetical protein
LDSSPSPSIEIVKYSKVGPESAVEIVGRVPSYFVTLSFDSPQEVSNEFGLAVAHSRGTPQRSRGQRVDRVDGWSVLHRRDARVVVQRLQHDRTYLAIRKEGVSGRGEEKTFGQTFSKTTQILRRDCRIREVTRGAGPADPGGRNPEGKIACQSGLMH